MKKETKKRVIVMASTKGGVGKSTLAWHLMPAVFPGCSILEIDNNNISNIFNKSTVIAKSESITLEECASKLEEVCFDLLDRSNNDVLVIDAGGGDDTLRVLKQIKELAIDEIADVTYIVPIMNSLSQLKNAEDMNNYLEGKNVIFALNNIADFRKIEEDWIFWFGNKSLGIESYFKKLNSPKCIYVPGSPIFEISALYNVTVTDFASPAQNVSISEFQQEIFKEFGDDKEQFLKALQQFRKNMLAKNFLDTFLQTVKGVLI